MRNLVNVLCGIVMLNMPLVVDGQSPVKFNLSDLVKKGKVEAFNRELQKLDDKAYNGIRLSKDEGEGVAWVKGVEFSEGTIEFDVKGENTKAHSFVGLALFGKDNATFDAIYVRPFNFPEENEISKSHQIQYISLPQYTWRVLRETHPNKYENEVNPIPDPNAWFHMKFVVTGNTIKVFIQNSQTPSLTVEKLTTLSSGAIGFYVADTSGGEFANLVVTAKKP